MQAMPELCPLTAENIFALSGKRVLVIGDVMLDAYLMGDAQRISPEAPVPIVRIEDEQHMLGGAGNVACSIAALGGSASLIGITGQDSTAEDIASLLKAQGIHPALYSLSDRPTTIKTRIMARRQQMLRLDRESTEPLSTQQVEELLARISQHSVDHDVLVLSDYAKGLFTSTLCKGLSAMLAKLRHDSGRTMYVLADPKPHNFHLFSHTSLLTPNLKETGEGIHMPVRNKDEIIAAGRAILRTFECKHLLSTLGSDGMALFESTNKVWHIPTVARDVFDVTGAGDTVIATIALALAAGLSLLPACILANYAAGIVVGKVGAATASQQELIDSLRAKPPSKPARWV